MNRDEINRYIHEEIMEKCWHEQKEGSRPYTAEAWGARGFTTTCGKCFAHYVYCDVNGICVNPDYCSDYSPRRLLNEVVARVTKAGGGSEEYHFALINIVNGKSVLRIGGYSHRCVWQISNATAEQIARACVEAHKESKK